MGDESNFRSDGHNIGDLEPSEREFLNGDAFSDVARENGGRGGHGDSKTHADIVSGDGGSRETIAGGNSNVDFETTVGTAVGTVDREVGGTNVRIVEVIVEGVLEADLDRLVDTQALHVPDELGAVNAHASIADEVVPLSGRNDVEVRGGGSVIVAHGVDVIWLAAMGTSALRTVGYVNDPVGVRVVNPFPGFLGQRDRVVIGERDFDVLGISAVD